MKVEPDGQVEVAGEVVASAPQAQVQACVHALVEACTEAAMAEVRLLRARADRESAPEVVSDAALTYRLAQGKVEEALAKLRSLQVKLLTEAAETAVVT